MPIAHEPQFNWEKLRADVESYMSVHDMGRKGFAYVADIDPSQMHRVCSYATVSGCPALMTLYKITSVLGTSMDLYIIDNRLK